MRRHLPNTLPHTDCTRRATAGRRNRYVRAAHIIYGTAAGNIIPATTVAPKYGNGSPVPVSGINFSYRIDHKKITDAAAIRLNSSKNSVKLRHYHVEYHRIRFIIRLLAPLSTATRRGNIIKFSRNSSCFQQNTSMQYDFCIFAESTLRTMPVPDTDLHHRFFRTRTSPNVTGIVLFYFRYVEFWWLAKFCPLSSLLIVLNQQLVKSCTMRQNFDGTKMGQNRRKIKPRPLCSEYPYQNTLVPSTKVQICPVKNEQMNLFLSFITHFSIILYHDRFFKVSDTLLHVLPLNNVSLIIVHCSRQMPIIRIGICTLLLSDLIQILRL